MRPHRHTSDESGAVAVVVAILLVAMLGIAALAVDLGSAWSTKRELVTDTDAAALAAAQALATNGCVLANRNAVQQLAIDAAEDLLEANLPSALSGTELDYGDDYEVRFGGTDDCETAEVFLTREAQTTFAGAVGTNELPVYSSSTATAQTGVSTGRLRPIAVCSDYPGLDVFLDGDGNVTSPTPAPLEVSVAIDKGWKKGDDCSDSPGNFGWLCFVGKCASTLDDFIRDGYPLPGDTNDVDLNGPEDDDNDCNTSTPVPPPTDADDCTVKTGSLGQSNNADINAIVCDSLVPRDCLEFPILITDSQTGNGVNSLVHPYGFMYVRLLDHCFGKASDGCPGWTSKPPASASKGNTNIFVFELLAVQREGRPDGSPLGEPPSSSLCANDSTDFADC